MIPEPRVVDSGCNNRSKDDHSFLRKSRFFVLWDFFVSSVSSHSIFVRDNSKLVFFSNPEINFTKTCMHACKILQVLPKIKNPSRYKPITTREVTLVQIPTRLAFPKNHFRRSKSPLEPRAHARAPARTRTRGIYSNIIRRTSIYIFPKGKIYIY